MEKVEVKFITARLNGNLLFVEAIQDCYSEVQVIVNKSDLDKDSYESLRQISWIGVYDKTFCLYGEAKDCTGTYGNLVVSIETRTFDFE